MKGGKAEYDGTKYTYRVSRNDNANEYNQAEADMLNFLMQCTQIGPELTDNTNSSLYTRFDRVLRVYKELNYAQKEQFIAYLEKIVFYRFQDLSSDDRGHSNQLQIMCNVLRTLGVTPTLSRVINTDIPPQPLNLRLQKERLQAKEAEIVLQRQAKQTEIEKLKEQMKAAKHTKRSRVQERGAAEQTTHEDSVPIDTYNLSGELILRIVNKNYEEDLQKILDDAAYFISVEGVTDLNEIIRRLDAKYKNKKGGTKRKRRSKRV